MIWSSYTTYIQSILYGFIYTFIVKAPWIWVHFEIYAWNDDDVPTMSRIGYKSFSCSCWISKINNKSNCVYILCACLFLVSDFTIFWFRQFLLEIGLEFPQWFSPFIYFVVVYLSLIVNFNWTLLVSFDLTLIFFFSKQTTIPFHVKWKLYAPLLSFSLYIYIYEFRVRIFPALPSLLQTILWL